MKNVALTVVVLLSAIVPTVAQKVESETGDRGRIIHLKTALNHLTVIEVSEPVVQVAAGSPSFKVEWRENKIFVQPTEANAATNLFIWTANQRLNYELEPAGQVAEMDFAVDEAPSRMEAPKPVLAAPQPTALPSPIDLLLGGKPVRIQPKGLDNKRPVEVWISDIFERDGRLLVRYAVQNHSNQPYSIGTPQVFQLDGARSPQSLYSLVNSQLADDQVSKLRIKQQLPVKVLDSQVQSRRIAPGEQAIGLIALQMLPSTEPTILRLQFPNLMQARHQRQVAAFLVR